MTHVADLGKGMTHYGVNWDNGRTLCLVCPPDRFTVLEDEKDSIMAAIRGS